MTNNRIDFISMAIKKMLSHGFFVTFSKSKTVTFTEPGDGVINCSGFFDEDEGELKVAVGRNNWFMIFIHEYCHFLQFLDKDEIYTKCIESYDKDAPMNTDGVEINKRNRKRALKALQALELDCEKRVLKLLEQYKLSIRRTRYIKKANAYIWFYSVLIKTGRWYKKAPYDVKEIIDLMPGDHLFYNYEYWPEYEELVMKHCYKE